MSTASLGGLFGQAPVKPIAPPSQQEITQQAVDQAQRQNGSLLQALAQQQRLGFRNQLSTASGVGPRLGEDQ